MDPVAYRHKTGKAIFVRVVWNGLPSGTMVVC